MNRLHLLSTRRAAGGLFATLAVAILFAAFLGCGDDSPTDVTPTPSYAQVDRMAIPTFNTVLIPSAQKEAFNRASPVNDDANYFATVQATITLLRAAVLPRLGPEDSPGVDPATLTGVLVPDVVTIHFSQELAFPNGRRLQDDVIDAALGLVLNRAGVGDGIAANDATFLSTFPYMAPPHVLPKPSR